MAHGPMARLVQSLRRAAGREESHSLLDADLVERFALHHDPGAFEMLVRRFGPMVFGVCQRVLGDTHAAEDAFQATFLILARKAVSLTRPALVGNWLYGVAYRTARRARSDAARRRVRERQAPMPQRADPLEEVVWRDLRPVLDEEIHRLPARYRRPFVLCYVEGRTNAEAAQQLGWPPGTLYTRLSRARQLLRERLTRRGIALSAISLGGLCSRDAIAAIPAVLVDSTVRAALLFAAGNVPAAAAIAGRAASFAEGVLHTMFMTKLKVGVMAAVLMATLASAGAGWGYRTLKPKAVHADRAQPRVALESRPGQQEQSATTPERAMPATPENDTENADPPPAGNSGAGFGSGFGTGFGAGSGTGWGMGVGSGYASHELTALGQKSVQRELKLSRKQRKQVRALQAQHQRDLRRLMPSDPMAAFQDPARAMKTMREAPVKMQELAKEVDRTIAQLLTTQQRRRLREISLQQRGGHALNDPEIARALQVTPQQQAEMQRIQQQGMQAMQDVGLEAMGDAWRGGFNPSAFQQTSTRTAQKLQARWHQLGDRLLAVLTTQQRAEWRKLTGEPFHGGRGPD